jgi:hypothetical protein
MRDTGIFLAALATAALVNLSPAAAQSNRTFVSGNGDDTNPCTNTFPCRTFAYAITQTSAGGEITAMDAAGYGLVTISKAITIANDGGGEASISTGSSTPAITITAGPTDAIILRGLTLIGNNAGNHGILFSSGGKLVVKNCFVSGFKSDGMTLIPNGSTAFDVSDTVVIAHVGSDAIGLQPSGSGVAVTAQFTRVKVSGADGGFTIAGSGSTGSLDVTITDSTASNNAYGIASASGSGHAVTRVSVQNATISNNTIDGVFENGANSTTFLARSTISGNAAAFSVVNGGTLQSFGDNYIKSNGNDGGAISLVSRK